MNILDRGQPVTQGQYEMKNIPMLHGEPCVCDSVFFLAYDEGGGPYDHVPPVPGHSNDFTNVANMAISETIRMELSRYRHHCGIRHGSGLLAVLAGGSFTVDRISALRLARGLGGLCSWHVVSEQGFAAQIGFRVPNMIISPFVRRHYVSHTPMDHTAILKFVESRFIGPTAHLTARDAAQPTCWSSRLHQHSLGHAADSADSVYRPNKPVYASMAPMNGVPLHRVGSQEND